MNTSKSIYSTLVEKPFSYGEALSVILENQGKAVSSLPEEDFVFPDKSCIRLTHTGVKLLEFLQE
jgi:hypothetical protein|nr:MAG: hypothetical protein [Caudoviricetes sp.]